MRFRHLAGGNTRGSLLPQSQGDRDTPVISAIPAFGLSQIYWVKGGSCPTSGIWCVRCGHADLAPVTPYDAVTPSLRGPDDISCSLFLLQLSVSRGAVPLQTFRSERYHQ